MIMSLPSRDERGLREFEYRTLRRKFGPKGGEMVGGWRKMHNEELQKFYSWPNIIRMLKSRRYSWTWHVAHKGIRGTRSGKTPLGRSRRIWNDNIKIDPREVVWSCIDWINRTQDGEQSRLF
jgi:hypothetical protein